MRDASVHCGRSFDVVLCADNSLPHLTTNASLHDGHELTVLA